MVNVRVLDSDHSHAFTDVALASLLLRGIPDSWDEAVRIFIPPPTLGFTRRDLRAPWIADAVRVAHSRGYNPVVRAPGGRAAAYGPGSVVVDHIARTRSGVDTREPFRHNSETHLHLLRSLGLDARIGELDGEYCPGEHSINIGGRYKIVGSAQRVTQDVSLFSTVFQVEAPPDLHRVLVEVSAALAYPFDPSTVGGIGDAMDIDVAAFHSVLVGDYEDRLGLVTEHVPKTINKLLSELPAVGTDAFDAEDWARARVAN
jgi:octanoyl-[GcvH]:protein N-octanoyltransferase